MKAQKVFISYSRQDKNLAKRILAKVEAFGFDVWLDEAEMFGGEKIDEKIINAIKDSGFFLVLLSKTSIASTWVNLEIDEAIKCGDMIHVIPLLLEDCSIPELLINFNYVDFSKSYRKGIDKLMRSIKFLRQGKFLRQSKWNYKETHDFACDSLKKKLRDNENYLSLAIDNALVLFHANNYDLISSEKIEIKVPDWVNAINTDVLNEPSPEELLSVIPPYYGEIEKYLKKRVYRENSDRIFNCKVGVINIEKPVERFGESSPLIITVIPLSYWVVKEFNRRIIGDPNDSILQKFKNNNQKLLTKNLPNEKSIQFNCPSALYIELAIVTSDKMVCIVAKSPLLSAYAAAGRGKWTSTVEEGVEWNSHILLDKQSLDVRAVVAKCLAVELKISDEYIESVKLNSIALEFPNLNTGIIGFCKVLLDSKSISKNFKQSQDFESIPIFTHVDEIEATYFENTDSDINWHPTARLRLHFLKEYIKAGNDLF